MFEVGQIVRSKRGHDKDKYFFVLDVKDDCLFIADGKSRTMDKPKKKKMIHVQIVNYVSLTIADKIKLKSCMDSDLRKELQIYKQKISGDNKEAKEFV